MKGKTGVNTGTATVSFWRRTTVLSIHGTSFCELGKVKCPK